MTLAPLLAAPTAVQVHAFLAMAAFVVGAVQLIRPKGGPVHRAIGYVWVAMMLVIATSSFLISGIDQWMGFSWIHLISIYVLVSVSMAIVHIRRGNVKAHRTAMVGTYVGGLVIAGAFTFLPGRIMHQVLFGP